MPRGARTAEFVGVLCVAVMAVSATGASSQDRATPTVTRTSGGSIRTELSPSIVVNDRSTLEREWIAIHDPGLPLVLEGTPGVKSVYEDGGRHSRGGFEYLATYKLTPSEPIVAVHVRFLVFDIWGEHIRTLGATDVIDVDRGVEKQFTGRWSLWSENECSEFYASIAYVARVRTKSGKVIESDTRAVLDEARKLSAKFTAEDLEPTKAPGQK